jgi:hypothetical protein
LNLPKINPENHEASDDANADSFPQNIKSIIATLRVVIDQLDSDFKQAKDLILEIARQLDEGGLCERNQISRTIKKILKDKIQEGKVTEKWIEECLAPEYKRQYTKSESSSLSTEEPNQQIIKVSTEGKQVSQEPQDDDRIQPSNKMESADKLEQSAIPQAGELEALVEHDKDNTVGTVTADSLTIDEEYACLMPALSDSHFQSIKLSIQEHRQCHVPISVNQDRVILDGHIRYRACRELWIKPEIMVRRFENRLEEKKFIVEVNLCRRHLNEFQRSELQRKLASIESQLAKGVNQEQKK